MCKLKRVKIKYTVGHRHRNTNRHKNRNRNKPYKNERLRIYTLPTFDYNGWNKKVKVSKINYEIVLNTLFWELLSLVSMKFCCNFQILKGLLLQPY